MAGNGDIRQKIVLEGEKEYSAALKEAQRNLKVLRSELKAETAELGKNATEQQKNETKTRNLQKQIKEQEKVVRTYEKALKEVREKYGDNEEAIAKWEVKLNDARTALANMKSGLDDTAASMNKVGTAAKSGGDMGVVAMNSLAQSLERVGSVGDSISSSLENAFTGIVGTIKETIGAVWGELMDIAAKSDNYMDLAAYFNTSATAVQKWDSAMKAASGDMSTVTSLITRLKYSGKEKNVAEWFGISAENYTDDLAYFQAVMQQMVDSREEMKRAGTWDTAMADIFGTKKGFDVEGVLSDWDAILSGLDRFDADKGGFALTEDQIKDMAELNLQVQTLKESWEALKKMATVELFGDLALNITGNLQSIVDAFKEYFDATDDAGREAALKKVRENIEKMFEAIKEAIQKGIEMLGQLADELQKSEDPAVRAFGSLLEKIVKVLEWFSDESNWDTVKRGFEALIGVWAAGKILKALSNISAFAANVKTIIGGGKSLFNLGGSGPSGGTDGGTTGGTGGTGGTVGGTAGKMSFGAWLTDALGMSGTGLIGGAAATGLIVYFGSKAIADINDEANKMREVAADAERYSNFGKEQANYAWGGMDNRYVLESYVNSLMKTTGDTRGINSPENILTRMAGGLGDDILSAFEYTNTSGEKRNKLIDMLNMDAQNAAVAAMMLHAAGISTSDIDYSEQYGKYEELVSNGSLGYSTALETLTEFFRASGTWQNGRWTIPGFTNTNGVMPVINGVPLANMSGYVMTSDNNKRSYTGTWDPSSRIIYSDAWGGTNGEGVKTELSASSISALGSSVKGAVSGIRVIMDGVTVGHLVAPTVSQDIARETAVP